MRTQAIGTIKVRLNIAFHSITASLVDILTENGDQSHVRILKRVIDIFTADFREENNRQALRELCREGYTAMIFGTVMVPIEMLRDKQHLVRIEFVYAESELGHKSFFINDEDLNY